MIKENEILESVLRFGRKIIPKPVFKFFQPFYHFLLSYAGALIYGFPSRKLIVIGVTGTKGKTTTCDLIAQILNGAGFKTGLITTAILRIDEKEWHNELKQTMLGRFRLQKFLRQMVREGCRYAVVETSSEGILQCRHRFIDYFAAVFTNLSPEHIERHGSFEKYREAKLKLFERVARKKDGVGIYNLDDSNAEYFLKTDIVNKYGYTLKSQIPDSKSQINFKYQISNIKLAVNKTEFDFDGKPFGAVQGEHFEMPLIGEFNVYNAAAAICVALSQDVEIGKIKEILKHAKPAPGRLEVINKGQPFTVIVDYAHEPASLEAVYKTLKIFNPRKIIAVLGAQGGGRDKAKRAIMGQIAGRYADYIILTNEDPYDENPEKIVKDIAGGLASSFKIIIDRREAIAEALRNAKTGDAVIITGKGAEPWIMGSKGTRIKWDDREVCREEIRKQYGKA